MHDIKHFIESFPPGVFPLMAASFGLVTLQTKIHKWLAVQSPKLKVTISVGLSAALVAIPHWIGVLQGDKNLLGAYGAEVLTVMNLAYNWLLRETPQINNDLAPAQVVVPETPVVVPLPQPDSAADFQAKP